MKLPRRLLPAALGLVALSIPVVAFAQDMMMGPLGTRDVAPHGSIYTDSAGLTVYSWQGDTRGDGMSRCYEACATAWPPVLVGMDMMMSMMPGMSMEQMMMPMMEGHGVLLRTDGTYQATYNGWPMYLFVRDTAPGEVNGHGSNGFGARWEVVPAAMM